MKKYLHLGKAFFQGYLVYRLNFYLWRFRVFVSFLVLVFFWLAIYGDQNSFLGYEKSQMIAYIIGIAFLKSLIMGSWINNLANYIRSGELSRLLVKPMRVTNYWLTADIVDKLINFSFTIIEISLVLYILKLPFYLPQQPLTYLYFLIAFVLAFFLYFLISFFLNILAFWTEEAWATRFLFGVVFLEFLAGSFFPLDILPVWLTRFIYWTPFPYLIFFPLKIWLEQVSNLDVLRVISISAFWLIFFYLLSKFLWRKGIKNYSSYGQ